MGTRVLYFNVQLAGTLTLALCLSSQRAGLSAGLLAALLLNVGAALLLHRAYRRGTAHAQIMARVWEVAVVLISCTVLVLIGASVAYAAGWTSG